MFVRNQFLSLAAGAAIVAGTVAIGPARAEDTVKIGLIVPMTGGQASTGKQLDNADQALHEAAWRHRRRQEDRDHPQG